MLSPFPMLARFAGGGDAPDRLPVQRETGIGMA